MPDLSAADSAVLPPPSTGTADQQPQLPPLRLVDLIATVKSTPSCAVATETVHLLNSRSVQMTADQLYSHLYSLHAFSRDLGRTLREMVAKQQSAGASSEELVAIMLRAIDELVEDHPTM